jgi:DNA repair protein RadC
MRIKDLPDSSKPRERFVKLGVGALSDAEAGIFYCLFMK